MAVPIQREPAGQTAGGRFARTSHLEGDISIDPGRLPLTHVTADLTVADLHRSTLAGDEVPLLVGIGGSVAFGLDTETSDRDVIGAHMATGDRILSMNGISDQDSTRTSHDPDTSSHEIAKFARLALGCRPGVLETLWLPHHAVRTEVGDLLIANRRFFLSQGAVRKTYGSVAEHHLKQLGIDLVNRDAGKESNQIDKMAKKGRHCIRYLRCGRELMRTGELPIDVSHWRDEIFAAGELAERDLEAFRALYRRERAALESQASRLPETYDIEAVDRLVISIRRSAL